MASCQGLPYFYLARACPALGPKAVIVERVEFSDARLHATTITCATTRQIKANAQTYAITRMELSDALTALTKIQAHARIIVSSCTCACKYSAHVPASTVHMQPIGQLRYVKSRFLLLSMASNALHKYMFASSLTIGTRMHRASLYSACHSHPCHTDEPVHIIQCM